MVPPTLLPLLLLPSLLLSGSSAFSTNTLMPGATAPDSPFLRQLLRHHNSRLLTRLLAAEQMRLDQSNEKVAMLKDKDGGIVAVIPKPSALLDYIEIYLPKDANMDAQSDSLNVVGDLEQTLMPDTYDDYTDQMGSLQQVDTLLKNFKGVKRQQQPPPAKSMRGFLTVGSRTGGGSSGFGTRQVATVLDAMPADVIHQILNSDPEMEDQEQQETGPRRGHKGRMRGGLSVGLDLEALSGMIQAMRKQNYHQRMRMSQEKLQSIG